MRLLNRALLLTNEGYTDEMIADRSNLLSFQFHGILQLIDEEYGKARGSFGRREEFFNGLRFSLRRFLHASWEDFMFFVIGDEDDG
ncbi:MAG: hypothetical protein LBK62_09645 [Treponema sp.]|jgi:hypothetical protein|nr:hypothetical protein [Treponema sp.]